MLLFNNNKVELINLLYSRENQSILKNNSETPGYIVEILLYYILIFLYYNITAAWAVDREFFIYFGGLELPLARFGVLLGSLGVP